MYYISGWYKLYDVNWTNSNMLQISLLGQWGSSFGMYLGKEVSNDMHSITTFHIYYRNGCTIFLIDTGNEIGSIIGIIFISCWNKYSNANTCISIHKFMPFNIIFSTICL